MSLVQPTSPADLIHEAGLVRIKRCRHGAMAYLRTEPHVGRSLELYGEWAEHDLQLLGLLISPGDVVVDVGAFIGTHAVRFAQLAGPTGAVVAFEPQRLPHQLLATNAMLNGVTTLRALHGAVGAASGAITVPDIDYAAEGTFGGLRLGSWTEGETVPVFALDALDLARCKLVKVDVEGMEAKVLDGARDLLARTRPFLYVEHNAPEGAPDVIERLLSLDYVCAWHFSPFFNAANFAGVKEDVFDGMLDANVIAVPRAHAAVVHAFDPVQGPTDTAPAALARRTQR